MICIYDEAFTINEMLEETGRCKDCKFDCPNAGKQMDDQSENMSYIEMFQRLEAKLDIEIRKNGSDTDEAKRLTEMIKQLQLICLEVNNYWKQ